MSNLPTHEEWQTALADFRRLQADINALVARYCTPHGSVTLRLERREDGGLLIWSDEVMGLIITAALPGDAMAKVWPALHALKHPITTIQL